MSLDYVDPTTPPPADWIGSGYPDPMFYGSAALWLALLVGAIIGIAIYRQRLFEERALRRRGPEVIYRAVRKALDQALMKTGAETVSGGRRVAEVMDLHLGPLFAFSNGCGSPFRRLRDALEGKPEKGAHGHGHHAHHDERLNAQPAVVVTAGSERRVTVAPAQIISPADLRREEHGHHPAELTAREQRLAVREALEQLSDYWRRDVVERDLRRIQEALCAKEPLGEVERRERQVRRRRAEAEILGPLAPLAAGPAVDTRPVIPLI